VGNTYKASVLGSQSRLLLKERRYGRRFLGDKRIAGGIHSSSEIPTPVLKFVNFFFFFEFEVLFAQQAMFAVPGVARSRFPMVHARLNLGLAWTAQHHRDLLGDQSTVRGCFDGLELLNRE